MTPFDRLRSSFRSYQRLHGTAWLAACHMLADIRDLCDRAEIKFSSAWFTSGVFYKQRQKDREDKGK